MANFAVFFVCALWPAVFGAFLVDFQRNPMLVSKWPTRQVNFRLHKSLLANETAAIRDAVQSFHHHTCLRFVEDDTVEENFIEIRRISAEVCRSVIGHSPYYSRNLFMGYWHCFRKRGLILHELMHSLGFLHEHQRPDRDEYVEILWDNVRPEKRAKFDILEQSWVSTFSTPYDPHSVMHYRPAAFSLDEETRPTIRALTASAAHHMGQQDDLSPGDIDSINMVYCSDADTQS